MRAKKDKELTLLKTDTIASYAERWNPTMTSEEKPVDGNSDDETLPKVVPVEVEKPIYAEADELLA